MIKHIILIILMCFTLCACDITSIIYSTSIVSIKEETINEHDFNYYDKFIDGKKQKIYRLNNNYELAYLLTEFDTVYFEKNNDINIKKVITLALSSLPYTYTYQHGSFMDFERVEKTANNPTNDELASQKADEIIAEIIDEDDVDIDKIYKIHNEIIRTSQYYLDAKDNDPAFDSYDILINHKGVCEAYSKAYMLFMNKLDIPSLIINSYIMNHAFNVVRFNDEWRFIDVTFDDPVPDSSKPSYDNFLLDINALNKKGSHQFDDGNDGTISYDEYMEYLEYLYD